MKIHEYQAKELLKSCGVPVPEGRVAASAKEAGQIARELGFPVVLKAQIHAGGRGRGGGIQITKSEQEVLAVAQKMIGMTLVTPQTGPEGKRVKKVLVEKASDIAKEYYLGMVLDRSRSQIVMMASSEGGVEIEEVAARAPEKIFKIWIDPVQGLQTGQTKELAGQLKLDPKKFEKFATPLCDFYFENDCSLVEINPLVLTKQGDLLALDAKINLDDNALFRHKDLAELLDPDEEDPNELEAKAHGLHYVSLDGNIGCLVNGAGLAMATMDIIKLHGGKPCNFLDVGGGASQEAVGEAFKLILRNPKVKAIFVNIFGGILRCDLLARGIVAALRQSSGQAAQEIGIKVPLVVRLLGTNKADGKKILAASGLKIISEDDFTAAANKAVECAQ